jgi:hypothetical protein
MTTARTEVLNAMNTAIPDTLITVRGTAECQRVMP